MSILPTCCCQRGELAIFSTHFAHPGLHYFAGSGSANKIFVHDMIFYVLVHFMDFYVFLCNPHITKCRILACTRFLLNDLLWLDLLLSAFCKQTFFHLSKFVFCKSSPYCGCFLHCDVFAFGTVIQKLLWLLYESH